MLLQMIWHIVGHAESLSNEFSFEGDRKFAGILRNESELNNQLFHNELRFCLAIWFGGEIGGVVDHGRWASETWPISVSVMVATAA